MIAHRLRGHMRRKRSLRHAKSMSRSAALFVGVVGAALAQETPEEVHGRSKVYVVGSNIPRPDAESALPVQIITRDDILRSGAATTPELLGRVSANVLGFND